MANLPVPREGFSAGSIRSTSFLCTAQSIQETWKTENLWVFVFGFVLIHAEILSSPYSLTHTQQDT